MSRPFRKAWEFVQIANTAWLLTFLILLAICVVIGVLARLFGVMP
jgi:hypothetical protein